MHRGGVGMLGHRYLTEKVDTVAKWSYQYRAPLVADLCSGGGYCGCDRLSA
jgi:hypothetical protein